MPAMQLKDAILRARGNYTQTEAAAKIGVAQSTWACWESGLRTPGLPALKKIAAAFGVSLAELVGAA